MNCSGGMNCGGAAASCERVDGAATPGAEGPVEGFPQVAGAARTSGSSGLGRSKPVPEGSSSCHPERANTGPNAKAAG